MTILAIECSSAIGSVAITKDGDPLHQRTFENPRGRGTGFFTALAETSRLTDTFDLIIVGTGPGSYNSLRVSIASAWGLARAREVPLRGLCSLLGYKASEYHVLGDARANQWFHAHICDGSLVTPPSLHTPEAALSRLTPGVPVFSTSPLLESILCEPPQAIQLARRFEKAGMAEPIYLKPPHITKPAC
ncbi:MAG: tRNA threonylcarbamoyladenosine biosynthesis protein TsaB [bacterium]